MEPEFKIAPFRVKSVGEDDGLSDGQFEGYASFFGNVDSYGDIVQPGAFTRTLEEWTAKGETIPVLWGHDTNNPFANIGGVTAAAEDENGLKVSGQLDLENPTAAQVYRLMKGRRTNRMSFAYSVRDSKKQDDGNHLLDLDLFEVSVVQIPANQSAEILAVKANSDALVDGLKAGRVLSSKNESELRKAHDAIGNVLAAIGEANDQGKATGEAEAKSGASDEEPPPSAAGAKSSASDEEPKSGPSVDAWATYITLIEPEGASL